MKAQENQFLPFLDGKKQFVTPIYQRTYSWQREQCEQLWNDIVRVGEDLDMPGHFIGSVVYILQGHIIFKKVPQFLLIDGQQRLTTLILLLTALAEKAQHEQGSSATDTMLKREIYDQYLINPFGEDEQRYKLLLTRSDREVLKNIIDHPEKIATTKTSSYLIDNYLFFREQLLHDDTDINTILSGINKLMIVEISLHKDHDNPQLIFESLNSTGMDLSQADLIRNYVLMSLDNDEQTKLYNDYWYPIEQRFRYGGNGDAFDRFMRDYLTLKQGVIPNISKVYMTFKHYQYSQYQKPIQEIVEDIARYAEYFTNIVFLHEEDADIKHALHDLNVLKVDVAYPFLLDVYDDYKNNGLAKADFIAIIHLVESYVFRRAICGVLTNSLNKIFATLSKEIDKTNYLKSVQLALLAKGASGRFPRDDEFKAAFVTKDMYNFPRRNYLLRKLEYYNNKERVETDNYTIEHIMPQNARLSEAWQKELGPDWKEIQGKYIHTIGNLTLTGYNSELSDRSFHEKRTMEGGFDKSPLKLNQSLAYLEAWNQDSIEKRADSLAARAINIWTIPSLTTEQISKYNYKQGRKTPLEEMTGPITHPQAGFIPDGFKLIQSSEKRFYLFRKIDGEWIQYGNGKNPWFAVSWDYARAWVQQKYQNNEMPLGIGGEKILGMLTSHKEESVIQTDYLVLESASESKEYTLEHFASLQGDMRAIFNALRKRILNLGANVREEYKKHYIGYKQNTKFIDIEPQKKALLLFLNMPIEEIDDPLELCEDVSAIGHHGNGHIRIRLTSLSQLDAILYLVQQAFDRQNNDEAAD